MTYKIEDVVSKIIQGDCLETIKMLPDKSVNCAITSPPYFRLRDYFWEGQWGMENSYQEYLEHLWLLMDEIYRVLRDDGTVWINLGDTFGGNNSIASNNGRSGFGTKREAVINKGLSKCLMLIPSRFAIGCIERGWILRNDCIWASRNKMPESVTDRFSKKYEHMFFFVKTEKYYFDLNGIRDKHLWADKDKRADGKRHESKGLCASGEYATNAVCYNPLGKNPGDVSDFWDIPTKGSSEKHYASFNSSLIDKPIIAGCPSGGIIIDPFAGTGTTLVRAYDLGRQYIGIEGKKEYVDICNKRLKEVESQLRIF